MLRISIFVMVLSVMTACSATEVVTDVPFSTATPRVVGTVPLPDSIGDSAIPADFTGGNPVILSSPGTFSVTINGDINAILDSGTIAYNYLSTAGGLQARNQLYISASDASTSQQLSFEFSPGIEPGQYNLVAPADYAPGNVAVSYARLGFDGTDTRIEAYTENIDGVLTLRSVGAVLSGEFQFGAEYTQTSPEGEVDVQRIAIIGRFDDVPYHSTIDDPFEINVPLPTRNFVESTQEP